jgi:phthalate 4,5-cis-dihydrodiol dehydrogenase
LAPTGKSSPTLNIGVIGLGGGASDMIPVLARHPHLKITAAADIDQGQLDKFQQEFQGETYLNAQDLCLSPRVDIVYIATPNQFHTGHTLAALERRKHVLVEKPMALTLAEADAMIEAAERNGVHLAVNVKHSFEPRIRKIREIVCSGELGQLRMINYWYFSDWLYRPRTAEELNPDLGGGVTWRQGPHQLDILRTIAGGLVRSVRAMTGVWDEARPVIGCHSAYLEFEDGVAATAVYSGYDHFNSRELSLGNREPGAEPSEYAQARQRLRQMESQEAEATLKRSQRYGGTRRTTQARRGPGATPGHSSEWVLGGPLIATFDRGDIRLTSGGLIIYGDEEKREISISSDTDGRQGIVNEVYQAIADDRRPAADGRWGKATLEVMLAVLESGRKRQEVFLSHQTPTLDVEPVR